MGLFVRTIGSARAQTRIGLANLVYEADGLARRSGRTSVSKETATPELTARLTPRARQRLLLRDQSRGPSRVDLQL